MIESLPERIHCVGAGGAGMLPLALYLAQSGHRVTAEDDALTPQAREWLERYGVAIQAFQEEDAFALVYSSAIAEEHPARSFARRTGSIAMRRGECLAVIAREKKLIAVAGSHGKTTTCGMLVDLFLRAGVAADYVLGALFESGEPALAGGSDWLIAEIDESDGTIELFNPEICVILNADHDHHARYRTEADYLKVFERLIQRTQGKAIVDSALWQRFDGTALEESRQVAWLGEGGDISFVGSRAGAGWSSLRLSATSGEALEVLINRSGAANRSNAAFALAAAGEAGCSFAQGSLLEFRAVKRRQRVWYLSPRLSVLEDYAHHPVEVDAVLAQIREESKRRLVVVFQPHRFSRTLALKEAFARSLAACDALILLDVYAASEDPLVGGKGEDLLAACREFNKSVRFVADRSDLDRALDEEIANDPSCILFLGAGVGDRLAKAYSLRQAAKDASMGSLFAALGRVAVFGSEIVEQEPLAPKTTMRVGGRAEYYFEPVSLDELTTVLKVCWELGLPVRPLGRGSNLVVPSEGVSGMVIRLSHPVWSSFELLEGERIRVGAGLRIKALCSQACKAGLRGYEFLEGIPGSLGGVLRMNAGAMGGWVFDVVESVRYVTFDGQVVEQSGSAMDFGYRYCHELKNAIAIGAVLKGAAGREASESIRLTIDAYANKRKESQPREPSAGCIFKNPEGDAAGRIIDRLGLKGAVVGGAEVSMVHGNFIINRGGATSRDVIELVRFVRAIAKRRLGVTLQPEVMLFGASWEEALKQR